MYCNLKYQPRKFSARTLKRQLDGVRSQAETLLNQVRQGISVVPFIEFSTLCSQMSASIIANGGDVQAAVKSTFSKDGALALAAQIASAGVLDKMGISMPNTNASVIQIADYSARKVLINSGMNVAFGREKLSDAFQNAGVNFLTDVVGILGANKIGSLYNNGEGTIDFTTHKLAHGALGLGLGALKGDAIAGALGGFVSELIADVTKDDVQKITEKVLAIADAEGVAYDSDDFKMIIREQVQATMNWGKVAAVVTAALARRDVNIALDVATNALENNFVPMIIGGALAATAVAISTYEINKAYEEGGPIAAAEQLGVEIAWSVAGGVTGKVVGKAIYKYGDTICSTLKEAVNLALKDQPGERLALGSAAAQLSQGAEKISNSTVVQFLQKADHKAEVFYGKLTGKASSTKSIPTPDYSTPEAPFSLRVDPITSKGPMHIDSRDFTSATSITAEGAQRNKNQFWEMWAQKYPETLSADNLLAITSRNSPRVDAQWIQHFPEHQRYLSDKLIHHHIEHGHLTTALPYGIHTKKPGNSMFHTNLGGNSK